MIWPTAALLAAIVVLEGARRLSPGDLVIRRALFGQWTVGQHDDRRWNLVSWFPPLWTTVVLGSHGGPPAIYEGPGDRAQLDGHWRYRSDREFKQTVDRYISEFERLLEDVSRDDRGQVLVRTYLTSETGKVYTMLAHASGRFE